MAGSTRNQRRSAAQLAADGFAALVDKLGMAEALRYVHLSQQGAGDYTRERQEWLGGMSREQVENLMAQTPKKGGRKRARGKIPEAGR